MTPQQLKNAILQQAIQGKLVEQRAEEGTGQELYKVIQDEKQKLIQEGKLKKQKALPEITEDEISFEIPKTWKWVRLGEIGDWGSGATPSRTNLEYYGGDIPWLKTGDLTDGYIYDVPEYITGLALERTSVRLNPKGSILIAMYGATIGKLGILTKAMTTNQACCACIVFPSIYNLYLFYFLLANRTTFIKKGEGGAQPNISKEKIVNTLIPLPPLSEQKRIVEKIEELFPLVERYEKAWARLEELNKKFPLDMQKAILGQAIQGKLVEQRAEEGTGEELYKAIQAEKQELIQEGKLKNQKALPEITEEEIPFEIPETWKWVKLGEIGDWGSGATPSRTNPEYYGGDIPWLKTGDLTDGYIYDVPEYITGLALERTSVRLNPKGSILIAMYGATIGKLGILTKAMTTNQACCACIVFPSIYNLYLFYFLLANRTTFIKKGEGGAQPNISKEKIVNTLIPLPPLSEQKRIVEKIEELLPLVEKLK